MKLKSQVVSLDLAKRLKELGVKQESLYLWHSPIREFDCQGLYPSCVVSREWWDNQMDQDDLPLEYLRIRDGFIGEFSAFTVAELGELLPIGVRSERLPNGSYGCEYPKHSLQAFNLFRPNEKWTEADARAMLLIYSIEKGVVRV